MTLVVGMVGPYLLLEPEPSRPGLQAFRAQRPGAAGFAKTVTIERIDPRYTEDPAAVERIVAAATIAAEVQHRTLVPLFELSEENGVFYFAREHVAGVSLATLLGTLEQDPEARLPQWLTLHVCVEVLTALAYLQERGMEHGAVDLDSVMISHGGEVKLIGTAVYAALDASDGRMDDVFALGVLLRRVLLGIDPIDGGFSSFDASISPDLGDLVLRMSAPDPRARPPTARAAVAALSRFIFALGPAKTSQDVSRALVSLGVSPTLRPSTKPPDRASHPLPREPEIVPVISRTDTLWDGATGEFYHPFAPPPPAVSSGAVDPLVILSFGDSRIESAETLDQLTHLWASAPLPPRLVARPGTTWCEALRFAERAGLEHLIEDDEQLREVIHVGDLATTGLVTLLADLQRASATGRLMIVDGSRQSRRVIDLSNGNVVRVATKVASDQIPEWLLRRGHTTFRDLHALFKEVIATETHLLDVVARRRRLDLNRLWSTAWIDRLAEPLRSRRGRFAFGAASHAVDHASIPLKAASLLVDAVRSARTPEQLRQWAAPLVAVPYALSPDYAAWVELLALDQRLGDLAQEFPKHETLESVVKKLPGERGGILLLAFLMAETRSLAFRTPQA